MNDKEIYEAIARGKARRMQERADKYQKDLKEMERRVERTPVDKIKARLDAIAEESNVLYNAKHRHKEYECYEEADVCQNQMDVLKEEGTLLCKKLGL